MKVTKYLTAASIALAVTTSSVLFTPQTLAAEPTKAPIGQEQQVNELIVVLQDLINELSAENSTILLEEVAETLDQVGSLDDYYEENEAEYFLNFDEEKKEILNWLKEDLAEADGNEKKDLEQLIAELTKTENEEKFFELLETFEEKYYDFETERKEILEELAEEIKYVEGEDLKTELAKEIKQLESINEEEAFFDKLEELYKVFDKHYEEYEDDWDDEDGYFISFDEEKKEILNWLKEDLSEAKGEEKKDLEQLIAELTKTEDEDKFFEILETFEEKYYDFETERKEILEELAEEIKYVEDEELKAELVKEIKQLESINEEEAFFDKLEKIYEVSDDYYSDLSYDEEDDWNDWDEDEK